LDYLRVVAARGDVVFLVILMSQERDPTLRRLEDRAVVVAAQSRTLHVGGAYVELAQKIAESCG
jgi:sterile alpha motif and leucine zipper containing kinase AZK